MNTKSKTMQNLPDSIILDILTRLPVKSLVRFKRTSKRWYHLLSHPKFAKMHCQRSLQDSSTTTTTTISSHKILRTNPFQSIDHEAFDVSRDHSSIVDLNDPVLVSGSNPVPRIGGSCHGLVFLVYDECLVLWNPTTKESRVMPKPAWIPKGELFYGFGYDSISDDYKFLWGVCFTNKNGIIDTMTKVFSLRKDSWTRVRDRCPSTVGRSWYAATYANDSIHWLARRETSNGRVNVLISFDLREEKFCKNLPLPDVDPGTLLEELSVHQGNVMVYHGHWDYYFEGWVMKEYGVKASWVKLFSIMQEGLPGHEFHLRPLALTRRENIVLDVDSWYIILFNVNENTYDSIPIKNTYDWLYGIKYIQSPVSPYRDNARLEMDF